MDVDPVFALSTALSTIGATGQLLAVHRPIVGWALSIAAQPLWYLFYILVGGWPLTILSTVYLIAAVLHLRKALRARRADRTDILNAQQTPAPVR